MVDSTIVTYAVTRALITVPFTIWLQWYYARHTASLTTHITCFISWSLAFSMIYVLPLDLIPSTSEDLYVVWQVIYWLSFANCWVIVPIIQGYYDTGEFRFRSRLWASIRFNVIFYVVAGVILAAFLLWKMVASHLTLAELGAFGICLANTWGLLLLILMLGYGLAEVPRVMWYAGNRVIAMKKLQHTLSLLRETAQFEQDKIAQVHAFAQRLDQNIPQSSPLRKYVDIILANTPSPDAFRFAGVGSNSKAIEEISVLDKIKAKPYAEITERNLADINYLAISGRTMLGVVDAEWRNTIDDAIELEAVTHWQHTSTPTSAAPLSVRMKGCHAVAWWRFRVFWSPIVLRVCAVICGIASLLTMYGEISLLVPTDSQISPFGALLDKVAHNVFLGQAISLVYLLYVVLASFFTLFRVRLGSNLYYMQHGGHTNEVSLLHNGAFMLRLMPALGYNFFAILHIEDTAFQRVVGAMEAIPFFGGKFNNYFPIFICVFAVLTFFNWFSRVLRCMNIPRFRYSETFEDEHITEGRDLLSRERRFKDETAHEEDSSTYVDSPSSGRGGDRGGDRDRDRDRDDRPISGGARSDDIELDGLRLV